MDPRLKLTIVLILATGLLWATGVNAQVTVLNSNVPPGFGQAGYIEDATLNAAGGGTLTMNGVTMIVPANSVIQFPANTITWADLFNPTVSAPVNDVAPTIPASKTGLALLDNSTMVPGVSPYLPFNAIVSGNIDVKNTTGHGAGAYIVALILPIGQDLGNGGQGFITFIDYAKGRFEVGGTLGVQNTGTVIEINDPTGRYGKPHSPDPRWSVDNENPTIATGNAYPMCIPRVAPPAVDLECPSYNRPLNPPVGAAGHDPLLTPGAPLQAFLMPAKPKPNAAGDTTPDPWKMAPFMLGDYIAYAGVLYKNVPGAVVTNFKTQTYISANTVSVDKLGIYTAAGTTATAGPAYVQLARMVIGTGGNIKGTNLLPNAALGIVGGNIILPEPRRNIVVVGFVTDSTQLVDIMAIDIDPSSGAETCRVLGTLLPQPGVFAGGIARGNKGRFQFAVGKGNFQPPTRVYAAYSRHGQLQLPDQTGAIVPPPSPQICADKNAPSPILTGGNGLLSGQYHAPMFGFQFPDSPPGFPNIPNNTGDLPFLVNGEGGNPSAGPLNPQPPVCPTVGGVPTCQP
jgi:hypothetical protein